MNHRALADLEPLAARLALRRGLTLTEARAEAALILGVPLPREVQPVTVEAVGRLLVRGR